MQPRIASKQATTVYARQEEALERRDALLEELRHLAGNYPDDVAVHESLLHPYIVQLVICIIVALLSRPSRGLGMGSLVFLRGLDDLL
jgi:hypothetical protein